MNIYTSNRKYNEKQVKLDICLDSFFNESDKDIQINILLIALTDNSYLLNKNKKNSAG